MKRKIYVTRDLARQDIFDYSEMFYNPVQKHSSNDMLSSIENNKKIFYKAWAGLENLGRFNISTQISNSLTPKPYA